MQTNYFELMMKAGTLNQHQAEELEAKIASNQEDTESRIRLLGFYCRKGIWNKKLEERGLEHELWFIQNQPEHAIMRFPYNSVTAGENRLYETLRNAWLEHTETNNVGVKLLCHAAAFFTLKDKELAVKLLERARNMEPNNPLLLQQLSQVYQLGMRTAKKSLSENWLKEACKVQQALASQNPENLRNLCDLASIAWRAGEIPLAKEALERLFNSTYSQDPHIRHEAHSIMGLINLEENDVNAAKEALLESGSWPSYTLANKLITLGEVKIVSTHLLNSLPSWRLGKIQLLIWILQLQLGFKPKLKSTILLTYGGYRSI